VTGRGRRRWWTALTLRGRLTLGLAGVLLLAGVVPAVATTLFLHGYLLGQLDGEVRAAGQRYAAADADHRAGPGQASGTLVVRLTAGAATVTMVGDDGRGHGITLPAGELADLRRLRVGDRPRTVELRAIGDYRLLAVPGPAGATDLVGLPYEELEQVVGRLAMVEGGVFVVVAAASAVLAAAIVRRTLRPLRQVVDTAVRVSGLPLATAGTALPPGRAAAAPAEPVTEADQVSVAFEHMLDHIRAALATRDRTEQRLRRFAADASHELRTPLATIQANAEYAAAAGPLPEPAATALGRISAASGRMATLVTDLLLLARLDAGRPLAGEPVDLTRLVLDAVAEASSAAPDHHWRLDLPAEPVESVGDAERLHQVLANLLGNARIHTPPGSTVTAALRRAGGGFELDVTDDGPGIPAVLLPDLFDRFSRGDQARGSAHGSTGLGLAIAAGIAAAHGGTLTVTSRPGRTTFRLYLPENPPPGTPRPGAARAGTG
jgi:two-component system, OmpR family, sensor kinase